MHARAESWRSELTVHTGLAVGAHDMLRLVLAQGDHVRAEAGTVWLTIDGRADDIVLGAGEVYTAPDDVAVNATGLDAGRLTVLGHRPLRWREVGATHTAWRSRARRVLASLFMPPLPQGGRGLG